METVVLKEEKALYTVFNGVKEVVSQTGEVSSDKYRAPNDKSFAPDAAWQFDVSQGEVPAEIDQITKGYLSGANLDRYKRIQKESGETLNQTIAPVARRRRRRNDYDGEICIDSYLSGATDYYRKVTRVKTQNRIVRVIIGATYNAGVPAEDIAKYNTKVVNRIEQILKEGKMVEVYASFLAKEIYYSSSIENAITLIKLKEADRGMDFQRVLTASIAGFTRYALFRAAQIAGNKHGLKYDSSLGYPINMNQNRDMIPKFVKAISNELGGEVLYLNGETEEGLKGISSKIKSK